MFTYSRFLSCFSICLISTTVGLAEEVVDAPPILIDDVVSEELTLERLQQLAITHNPTLSQARAETWKAKGQYTQAGLYPNPTLGYTGGEIGNEGKAGQQGFFVSQEFVTGGKLSWAKQVYGMKQKAASSEMAAQHYRVENNVRREYYKIIVAQRLLKLAKEIEKITNIGVESTKARAEQLESSKVILLQAQIENQRALILKRNAEVENKAAWKRLKAVIGWPELKEQELTDVLTENIPDLTWESTLARLLERSPEVQRATYQAASARARFELAKVQPIPNITVQAGAQYDYNTKDQIASLQIGLPIPIFNKNQGNIATAQYEWIRASKEVKRLQLAIARDLASEYQIYSASRSQMNLYQLKLLPASEESLKLSQLAFDAGEHNYIQLLTAQRTFVDTNIELVKTLASLWDSIVTIDGLMLKDGLQSPKSSLE